MNDDRVWNWKCLLINLSHFRRQRFSVFQYVIQGSEVIIGLEVLGQLIEQIPAARQNNDLVVDVGRAWTINGKPMHLLTEPAKHAVGFFSTVTEVLKTPTRQLRLICSEVQFFGQVIELQPSLAEFNDRLGTRRRASDDADRA